MFRIKLHIIWRCLCMYIIKVFCYIYIFHSIHIWPYNRLIKIRVGRLCWETRTIISVRRAYYISSRKNLAWPPFTEGCSLQNHPRSVRGPWSPPLGSHPSINTRRSTPSPLIFAIIFLLPSSPLEPSSYCQNFRLFDLSDRP